MRKRHKTVNGCCAFVVDFLMRFPVHRSYSSTYTSRNHLMILFFYHLINKKTLYFKNKLKRS